MIARYLFLFLFITADFDIAVAEPLSGSDDVVVEISRQDLRLIGSWPIERRWYALAIENLIQSGADSIFIDIAFPSADPVRPESDRMFYNVISQYSNVFLLNDQKISRDDSLYILGTKPFPVSQSFTPFSESLTIYGSMVLLTDFPKQSLAAHVIKNQPDEQPIAVKLPSNLILADFSFLDVIKNNFSLLQGSNVLVYLNHPGFTSYIAVDGNRSYPSSLVQWFTINEIRQNHFIYLWSNWKYMVLGLLLIVPTGIFLTKKRKWVYILAGIYIVGIGLIAVMFITRIYTPSVLYIALVVPVPFMLLHYIRGRFVQKLPGEYFEKENQDLSPSEKKELEDLRYRIGFYDKLKKAAFKKDSSSFESDNIVCHQDSPVKEILVKARNVAGTSIPIIITGESGTGKEELARFIHKYSDRSEKPFIAINCGSLNKNLIESELFGYEKGAFTGADQMRQGRFELADGGTLFLDEIAETDPAFQVKLLRVLQEGSFERVGGSELIHTSVRIIAATHRDPQKLVQNNAFREDLYYRLNGFRFHLPPLRERTMDIPLLFDHFVQEASGNEIMHYSDVLLKWLTIQSWFGNVRELKSATSRAVLNASIQNRDILLPDDFELDQPISARDEKAVQMLELFKKFSEDYRFISRVAESMNMHRVTVTEYLRGWIIYYLSRGLNAGQIAQEITHEDVNVEQKNQLAQRMETYRDNSLAKIEEGLDKGLSESDIEDKYFAQLPKFFSGDLHLLIRQYRIKNNLRK